MRNRLFQKKSGYVLPTVIIAVLIIMLFSATLLGIQGSEIKMRKATEDRIKAKYIAEAGLEASVSALVKSIQHGLDMNHVSTIDIIVPISINKSPINGQQYDVFRNKEKTTLDNVVFKVEQIANTYAISDAENPKSIEVYSLGKLYDTSGTVIRTYGISATVTFELDIANKAIVSYDVEKWSEES